MNPYAAAVALLPLLAAAPPNSHHRPPAPKIRLASTAAVERSPVKVAARPTVEMVFVLDTTGSMSGLIEGAKARIWGIVNEVMASTSKPQVRIGLVGYRDKGDTYVTQVVPLTSDLDSVYAKLMDFRADGGGDTPENVRRALKEGVIKAGWSPRSPRVAQVLFLVGDAPPHEDYQEEPSVTDTAAQAVGRGIVVNSIQCGSLAGTRPVWEKLARAGEGEYFAIAQDGGVQAIATPYDGELATLGTKIGGTYMAYGGGMGGGGFRANAARSQMALESRVAAAAPAGAAADRAVNKAINAYAYRRDDLLQSVENGEVKLDAVKKEDLPDDLQKLSPEARKKEIDRRLSERKALRARNPGSVEEA